MAEPAASAANEGFPDPASLRRALREAIEATLPEIRVVAEGFLAEVSPIDLLAVGGQGELISIRIAEPDGDAVALTRALADLSWLRPRQVDFLKLAPGLGIEPSAEPRALLVARDFGRETLAAADNFPAETVQLWRWRSGAENGRPRLRIEAVAPGRGEAARDARPRAAPVTPSLPARFPSTASPVPRPVTPRPERNAPLTAPPSPSAFRTGLVDTDLEPAHRPDPEARPSHRSDPANASDIPSDIPSGIPSGIASGM